MRLPSAAALFPVFPLNGMPMARGYDPKIIVGALILNAAWGFGVALSMRVRAAPGNLLPAQLLSPPVGG